jgi:hypothetical protein
VPAADLEHAVVRLDPQPIDDRAQPIAHRYRSPSSSAYASRYSARESRTFST